MSDQTTPPIETSNPKNTTNKTSDSKYGTSIFKKWIYGKFDARLILEIVQKDIYFNPKLAILLPTLNPVSGKKTFLSATLDLKALQTLQTEITSAIKILEEHNKKDQAN